MTTRGIGRLESRHSRSSTLGHGQGAGSARAVCTVEDRRFDSWSSAGRSWQGRKMV